MMKNTTLTRTDFEKMTIYRFRNQGLADSFADHATKTLMVIMGDDERFWVVTMADGERLIRGGYEVAPRTRIR
jgi:hypothetical protein